MLKAIEKLLNNQATEVGNHSMKRGNKVVYYNYFSTAICTVNYDSKVYMIDNGGYNTRSTTRAINDYRSYFNDKGFKELDRKSFKQVNNT